VLRAPHDKQPFMVRFCQRHRHVFNVSRPARCGRCSSAWRAARSRYGHEHGAVRPRPLRDHPRATPRQSELMIVAGTLSVKMPRSSRSSSTRCRAALCARDGQLRHLRRPLLPARLFGREGCGPGRACGCVRAGCPPPPEQLIDASWPCTKKMRGESVRDSRPATKAKSSSRAATATS